MGNENATSLYEILHRRGGNPLSPNEALVYLKAITASLTRLHARGLVHGDVQAANVFQDSQGQVYLDGVGFAQHIGSRSVVRQPVESVPHLAPELVSYQVVNEATDVYSLGILTYEMLTGEMTLGGSASIRPPRAVNPSIPSALSDTVMRALASDSSQRFPTPEGFFAAACRALNLTADQVADRVSPAITQAPATVVAPALPEAPGTVVISTPPQAPQTMAVSSTTPAQRTVMVSSAAPVPDYAAEYSPPDDLAKRKRPVWLWISIGAVGLLVLACLGFFVGSILPGLIGGEKASPTPTWTATLLASETPLSIPTQPSTTIPLPPIATDTLAAPPPLEPSATFTFPPPPPTVPVSSSGDLQIRNRYPFPIYVFRDQKLLNTAPIPTGMYLIFFNQPAGPHLYSFCKDVNMNTCDQKEITIAGDMEITVP